MDEKTFERLTFVVVGVLLGLTIAGFLHELGVGVAGLAIAAVATLVIYTVIGFRYLVSRVRAPKLPEG